MSNTYAVFEGDGFSVESNTHTAEQLAETFGKKPDEKAPEKPATPPAEPQADGDGGEAPEPAKTAPATNGEVKEAKLGKPRHDPNARINQLTREARTAERERDEIQRRAEAAETELRKFRASQPEQPKQAKADGPPKLEDFEGVEEWGAAMTRWGISEDRKAQAQETRKTQEEQRRHQTFSTFSERIKAHMVNDPGFFDRVSETVVGWRPLSDLSPNEIVKPENIIAEQFVTSESPAALIEYLSGHPDEIQRLSTLHPLQLTAALGRIEERLSAANPTATARPEVSKAAPPARPVTGGPPIRDNGPSADDDDETYRRKRLAQDIRKRSR